MQALKPSATRLAKGLKPWSWLLLESSLPCWGNERIGESCQIVLLSSGLYIDSNLALSYENKQTGSLSIWSYKQGCRGSFASSYILISLHSYHFVSADKAPQLLPVLPPMPSLGVHSLRVWGLISCHLSCCPSGDSHRNDA